VEGQKSGGCQLLIFRDDDVKSSARPSVNGRSMIDNLEVEGEI